MIDLPNYQVGETARVDVVTPFKLVVIDPVATARLKLEEARNGQVVFRHDPAVADEVIENLHVAFTTSREKFLSKVQAVFQKRELSDEDVDSTRFRNMVQWFQWENKLLPLDLNLARLWAQGGSDKELVDQLTVKMRGVMQGYIRLEEVPELPAEPKNGPLMTRMLTIRQGPSLPGLAAVEQQSQFVRKQEIITLEKAKRDFRNTWPAPERKLPRIVEKLFKTNCVFDAALTRQMLAAKIDSLYSATQYDAGKTIVRRGDVIDARVKAALDQLRSHLAEERLRAVAGHGIARYAGWWWGAVAFGLFVGMILWQHHRRSRAGSTLSVLANSAAVVRGGQDHPDALAHSGLMPYLARLLADKLVQRLFSQRTQLLTTQNTAAKQATDLEERLAKVQTQMQDRFQAYEQRIAELENELALSEGEKRDLIRAKIVLARQEYEEEQAMAGSR